MSSRAFTFTFNLYRDEELCLYVLSRDNLKLFKARVTKFGAHIAVKATCCVCDIQSSRLMVWVAGLANGWVWVTLSGCMCTLLHCMLAKLRCSLL